MPAELRTRYFKNKAKVDGDQDAMERWASLGYASGGEVDTEEDFFAEEDPAYD